MKTSTTFADSEIPPPRIYLAFLVQGDFDPQRITEATGIEPSKVSKKGDILKEGTDLMHKRSQWIVRPSTPPTVPWEEQLESLMSQLEFGWEALKQVTAGSDVGLSCAVYPSSPAGWPPLVFTQDVVTRMGEIGAWIDVDAYLSRWFDQETT